MKDSYSALGLNLSRQLPPNPSIEALVGLEDLAHPTESSFLNFLNHLTVSALFNSICNGLPSTFTWARKTPLPVKALFDHSAIRHSPAM